MKKLIGLLNLLETQPCFGVAVFEEDDHFYTQVLNEFDQIIDFELCSIPKNQLKIKKDQPSIKINSPGIFCFYFSSSDITYSTKDKLKEILYSRIERFQSKSFLLYEIAKFIGNSELIQESHKACEHKLLKSALKLLPKRLRKSNKSSYIAKLFRLHSTLPPSKSVQHTLSASDIIQEIIERLKDETKFMIIQKLESNNYDKSILLDIYRNINELRSLLIEALIENNDILEHSQEDVEKLKSIDIYEKWILETLPFKEKVIKQIVDHYNVIVEEYYFMHNVKVSIEKIHNALNLFLGWLFECNISIEPNYYVK